MDELEHRSDDSLGIDTTGSLARLLELSPATLPPSLLERNLQLSDTEICAKEPEGPRIRYSPAFSSSDAAAVRRILRLWIRTFVSRIRHTAVSIPRPAAAATAAAAVHDFGIATPRRFVGSSWIVSASAAAAAVREFD